MSGFALDLSGADTKGIEPVPSGPYDVTVYEATIGETSGKGKLPGGTPMLKVQFAIPEDAEDYKNRRFFGNYPLKFPDDYDKSKVAKMQGNLVKLLEALGYSKDEVMKKSFKLDPDDLVGRSCVVVVGIDKAQDWTEETPNMQNVLKGVKPAGSNTGGSSGSGLL